MSKQNRCLRSSFLSCKVVFTIKLSSTVLRKSSLNNKILRKVVDSKRVNRDKKQIVVIHGELITSNSKLVCHAGLD